MPSKSRQLNFFPTSCLSKRQPSWETCSLFSGSSGNVIYVNAGRTGLLIDAGMPAAAIDAQLLELEVDPTSITAILITHEHSDHIKGAGAFARKHRIPLYVAPRTWSAMEGKVGNVNRLTVEFFVPDQSFSLGDTEILPFRISHDAADPVGFRIATERGRVAVCTDLGEVTQGVKEALAGVNTVYLESNYDEHLLFSGRYPYPLKKRISGPKGHLSNVKSGFFAADLVRSGTERLILSHLSKENNFPELAELTVAQALCQEGIQAGKDVLLETAPRHGRGNWQVLS